MAAPTNTYCAWATGNDYKGASFTDGAWTASTHTLTKAGAFAATLAGHWLYLEPNGGVSFTAGYFKVATVPDANSVTLATDPAVGDLTDVKCTQADGSTTKPWRSVQGALDLITRDATNGDQINVKAGSAQVLSAALELTTYGTPAEGAPLILRGCNASWVADGTLAEIDCGGATMWANAAYPFIMLIDLEMHSFGNNHGVVCSGSGNGWLLQHCEVHKGASSPSGKNLFYGGNAVISNCYFHDAGAVGTAIYTCALAFGNYIVGCELTGMRAGGRWAHNIVRNCTHGMILGDGAQACNNIIYHGNASTGEGIWTESTAGMGIVVLNNIIIGYSGTGGKGIYGQGDIALLGYNAFYNNATAESLGDVLCDLGGDVTLAADPFVDAANGDFSLTAAAKAALRGVGWPAAYLGAHANTDGHVTIGAIQYGEDETAAAVYPAAANVLEAETAFGPTGADYAGTYHEAEAGEVESGVTFGPASAYTGTLAAGGSGIWGTFGRW